MKKFLVIALMSVGLLSCSSCAKKTPPTEVTHPAPTVDATPDTPAPPTSTRVVHSSTHWELSVPSNEWVRVNPEDGPDTVALVNGGLVHLLVMEQVDFPGTLDVFTLVNIRALRNSGAELVSAKQVEVNGHKFVLVEATKNNTKVWQWLAVDGTRGFGLSCGGPSEANHEQLCRGIAATLKLK